ncbi:MAG TPA: SH3 domain-containing protein [Nitrospiraceae bacterium]
MAAFTDCLTMPGTPFQWSLLFARQPEPDLEFTEEELEQTTTTRPMSPMKPGKKSGGGRPIMWVLLLILVGGIAYVAMEPEMLTELLNPILGENAPVAGPSPRVMTPKPQPPATAAPVPAPTPEPAPAVAAPAPPAPAMTPPGAAPAPTPTAQPAVTAIPMFAEGQKVTVTSDPTAPGEGIPLSTDSSGAKPGAIVKPGVTLTVLDGELQGNSWVYSVRTDEGMKGWVPEKRLRLKF